MATELDFLKLKAEAMARLERRDIETFIAAVSGDLAVLDALLQRDNQKDHDEYIEEMSLGGQTYRERR